MGSRIKLEGTTVNDLFVSEYLGKNKYLCICKLCGDTRECRTYELSIGKYKACRKCEIKLGLTDSRLKLLTGQEIGYWQVGEYLGNKKYRCLCTLCNREFEVYVSNLKNGKSKSCVDCANDIKRNNTANLVYEHTLEKGKILEKLDMGRYLCECGGCGKKITVAGSILRNKKSVYCINCKGLDKIIDITGQTFGNLQVIERAENRGERVYYKCKCLLCGKVYDVLSYNLRHGNTKSCGCQQLIDLTGKQIFEWNVIEYKGNNMWLCRCSCGAEKEVHSYELRSGHSKSCGCKKWQYTRLTLLDKYGEIVHDKFNNKRSEEQLKAVESKENMIGLIENLGYTPTTYQLSELLGINVANTLKRVHKFNLEDYVDIGSSRSKQEIEILDYISNFVGDDEIVLGDREVLDGKEIDIWIPSKKIGIEVNGVYWHSTVFKDRMYHRNKSLYQYKKKIRLVHIYEYEWEDEILREKIKQLLESLLAGDKEKVYARNCDIREVDVDIYKDFTEKYHLQGYSNASIILGCYLDNELLGVMSFGKSRFNDNFEWEIIRMCWLPGIRVIGGSGKLFKYFIDNYSPKSVISYCDIGKFRGDTYSEIGMKSKRLSEPNYVWVKSIDGRLEALSRYQTQKKKLLELGFGTEDMTEVEIMESLGWLQVYDSGNMVFEYHSEKEDDEYDF